MNAPTIRTDGLKISPDGQAWGIVTEFRTQLVPANQREMYVRELRRKAWELIKQHHLQHDTKVALGEVLGLEVG